MPIILALRMMEVWLSYRVPVLPGLQNKTFFNKLKEIKSIPVTQALRRQTQANLCKQVSGWLWLQWRLALWDMTLVRQLNLFQSIENIWDWEAGG